MTSPPKQKDSGALVTKMRVIKKLDPSNRGAIKLAQQFGTRLVCVRHRVDAGATFRFTTVELLVDKSEMQPRQPQLVNIRVNPKEYGLRSVVRAAGAKWDYELGLWRMPKRVVTVLRLTDRIVKQK
jgi:hypothetical protein